MAKKYSRSQYKKERNANKDTRPKATLKTLEFLQQKQLLY